MPPNPAPWQNALLPGQVHVYSLVPLISTHDCEPQSTPQDPQCALAFFATQLLLQQYPPEQLVPLAMVREHPWDSARTTAPHAPAEHLWSVQLRCWVPELEHSLAHWQAPHDGQVVAPQVVLSGLVG